MGEPAIGIDLGTTNSCVCMVKRTQPTVISNTLGSRTTPSVVAFTDEESLIGEPAQDHLNKDPTNTIYEVKRFIGSNFDEAGALEYSKYPFTVIKDEQSNGPLIEVQYRKKLEQFKPEFISSMILRHMKKIADATIDNGNVLKAVVTIPAYFNQQQRQATKDAVQIAGFEEYDLLTEPTAAAFAYKLNDEVQKKKVLVYDFGGGTFDVSIVQNDVGAINVGAIDGNTRLGGLDFDKRLVEFALKTIKKEYKKDFYQDDVALGRLKGACEKVKKTLTSRKMTSLELEYKGKSYGIEISRALFEDLCEDLFSETLQITERCLKYAEISKDDVDEVLLIGGSTRIPRIQEMLKEYFGEKKLSTKINADEAVAVGAAIYAAMRYGSPSQKVDHIILQDVIPVSLGTQLKGGLMDILIRSNTSIPQIKTKRYYTEKDHQREIIIDVYEGERQLVKDNIFLGEFGIAVPPLPNGECSVLVTFEVDVDGILQVSAREEKSNKIEKITIDKTGRLEKEDIKRMVEEAKLYEEQDQVHRENIEARNELEGYALRARFKHRKLEIPEEKKEMVIKRCEEAIEWSAAHKDADKSQIEDVLKDLKEDLKGILNTITDIYIPLE